MLNLSCHWPHGNFCVAVSWVSSVLLKLPRKWTIFISTDIWQMLEISFKQRSVWQIHLHRLYIQRCRWYFWKQFNHSTFGKSRSSLLKYNLSLLYREHWHLLHLQLKANQMGSWVMSGCRWFLTNFTLMRAPVVWWLGARALTRGLAVTRQGQYLDGWPELSTRFLNTTPPRPYGLDSENRSHGSPLSFGWDVKSRSLLPSALC